MGTDFLQLLDRRTAEIVIAGTESDLAALVDLKTTSGGPPVWRSYWSAPEEQFIDFDSATTAAERLEKILKCGSTVAEIKQSLIRDLCVSRAWLHLDYWGCWAEVFSLQDPPGALTWENFTASLDAAAGRQTDESTESSGCYLLTRDNVDSILSSLETHALELEIMHELQVERLRGWQALCCKHQEFCMLYQKDF